MNFEIENSIFKAIEKRNINLKIKISFKIITNGLLITSSFI